MLNFVKNDVLKLHIPFHKIEKGDVIEYDGKFYAFDKFARV
ncbi:MAG: hypothetical protein ACOC2W_02430 [bacterium]